MKLAPGGMGGPCGSSLKHSAVSRARRTASTQLAALSRHDKVIVEAPMRKAPGKQPGAFDGALLVLRPLPYGVRFPNQMKPWPSPSLTLSVQPKPFGHDGPLVGKVSCQPVCTVSQTVYVPAGRPGNRLLPEGSVTAVALTGPL